MCVFYKTQPKHWCKYKKNTLDKMSTIHSQNIDENACKLIRLLLWLDTANKKLHFSAPFIRNLINICSCYKSQFQYALAKEIKSHPITAHEIHEQSAQQTSFTIKYDVNASSGFACWHPEWYFSVWQTNRYFQFKWISIW